MSLILGIESSCDETAVAVVEDGGRVLSSQVASQIARHAEHGGVVPELAAREHLKALDVVLNAALTEAEVGLAEIDGIAVTQGPGLIPALLVGLNYAKGLAAANNLPLYGVNHFLAHIYGAFLPDRSDELADEANYPMLALVVSGGHTNLLLLHRSGRAEQLGGTLDDAAGEALDKAAKLLDLGYPGGPAVQRAAESGDCKAFHFPRPLLGQAGKAVAPENRFNFSFSGIKTALLYTVRDYRDRGEELPVADLAAGFQDAVVEVLVRKTFMAAREHGVKMIIAAGGVACNARLRSELENRAASGKFKLFLAPGKFCTDNAAMVAGIGYHYYLNNPEGSVEALGMDAYARLPQFSEVPFIRDVK